MLVFMSGQLYLYCGDDDYLVDSAARERIGALVPEADRKWGVELIDGRKDTAEEAKKAIEDCMGAVQTPGLFGSAKVVWLRDANFLTGSGKHVSEVDVTKDAVAHMTEWLRAGLVDGQNLVITAPKVLKTSLFYKVCLKAGKIEDFGTGLKPWQADKVVKGKLDGFIKDAGLTFASGAQAEFLLRVGASCRSLVQELEKLKSYVYPAHEVTVKDIREITTIGREAQAWEILDAVGARDPFKALETLNRLSGQKGIAIIVSAMLDRFISELLVLHEAYDRKWIRGGRWADDLAPGDAAILAVLPVNPSTCNDWNLNKKLPHALNFSVAELRAARFYLVELREKLVSCQLPELYLLETTLLRIIGRKA
jgi:DNA polymerase III delta subunit